MDLVKYMKARDNRDKFMQVHKLKDNYEKSGVSITMDDGSEYYVGGKAFIQGLLEACDDELERLQKEFDET